MNKIESNTSPTDSPQITRLTGAIGAEVTGIKLAGAGAEIIGQIRGAAVANRMIVIRDQFLRPEDFVAFARQWGPLMLTRGIKSNHRVPPILVVGNPGKEYRPAETWHTDATTSEIPPAFTMLSAETLPKIGGDTLFVDMAYAYRTLSPTYRRLLRGFKAHHLSRPQIGRPPGEPVYDAWHPLVRTIPETGERALYLGNPLICTEIEGMSETESRSLLDFLFNHAVRIDGMYRHRWLPGDVVIWDNRSTMHYAVYDYGDERRDMLRLTVEGERPFEAPYAETGN